MKIFTSILLVVLFNSCKNESNVLIKNEKPENKVIYDSVKAQRYGADEYGMKKYVMAFLKRGPNRDLTKEESSKLQSAHMKNINKMVDEGKLVLAGPFFGNGDLRGIYIFNVESIEEAEVLTNTDPAIIAGSLEMELIEWYGTAAIIGLTEEHYKIAKKNH